MLQPETMACLAMAQSIPPRGLTRQASSLSSGGSFSRGASPQLTRQKSQSFRRLKCVNAPQLNKKREMTRRSSLRSGLARVLSTSGVRPRTAEAARLLAHRAKQTKPLSLKEKIFLIVEEPSSSLLAKLFAFAVRFMTIGTTVAATLRTVEDPAVLGGLLRQWGDAPYLGIRSAGGFFFAVEAFVRVVVYQPFHRCLLDPFIWLDLLTPLPFLIGLVLGEGSLPILEAWGSIRLLKLCRFCARQQQQQQQQQHIHIHPSTSRLLGHSSSLLTRHPPARVPRYRRRGRGAARSRLPALRRPALRAPLHAHHDGHRLQQRAVQHRVRDGSRRVRKAVEGRGRACRLSVHQPVGRLVGMRRRLQRERPQRRRSRYGALAVLPVHDVRRLPGWTPRMPQRAIHANLPDDSACDGAVALSSSHSLMPPAHASYSHSHASPTPPTVAPHASQWFLVVTVTTVGFGDVSPNTVLGQAFISGVILLGIIFLAMPLSVVGNNFQQVCSSPILLASSSPPAHLLLTASFLFL